jgi:membrane dipeptidase
MNRRTFLVLGTAAPMLNLGRYRLFAQTTARYSARAIDLVRQSTVIDMLNPASLSMVLGDLGGEKKPTWLDTPESFTAADLARFRESGWNVLHIAVGTGSYDETLRFLALWNGLIAHHGEHFLRIDSPARLGQVKASGKLGIILGIQNSDHFRTLDDIDFFYSLGQRVSQLTYNARNLIGSGSTERNDSGLSDYGVRVVERMNKLGMVVDLSHCGDRTTLDGCECRKNPRLSLTPTAGRSTPIPDARPMKLSGRWRLAAE